MGNEKTNIRRLFQQKLAVWLLLISAGVLAYGVGLYQGSQFRMNRAIASTQKPVVVDLKNADLSPALPSSNPSNTESPKSHSE
jgi:hypothetical protein